MPASTLIYILYKGDIQQKECEEGSLHAVLPPLARNAWPYPQKGKHENGNRHLTTLFE